ncbi:MAG: hypothetical protein WBF71_16865 [Microthrixaceae bacterium]
MSRGLRSRALLAIPLLAVSLGVAACTPPTTTPPTTTIPTDPEPTGPTISGEACQPNSGVTVVVDFTTLDDSIKIGCAPGEQADGFSALAATGFTTGSESGAGTLCTIDGLPTEGYPFCWLTGGYWSYWMSANRTTPWAFSPVGISQGPISQGTVLGFSWAPAFDGAAPGVSVADLADYTPELPECEVPDAPVLSIIDDQEVLPFAIPGGGPIQVAVQAASDDPADAVFTDSDSLSLTGHQGLTRVLARSGSDECQVAEVFDAVYDVRDGYTGRPDLPGSTSTAVAATSSSLIGWASGFTNYIPGSDVTATFQTPEKAVGPYGTDLVVLGNGGQITMTFDTPITNGSGDDFAIFENGFTSGTGELLFTELGYVEVSSNGVDFVQFDSASQQPTAVGAFAFQDPRLLGGLAGKDPGGWGTVFDLSALSNKPEVRNGTLDLSAITHVRILDVVGASDYPNPGDTYNDSFGRQLFDTHKTTGSGGFDLRAVGVLNQSN